MGACVAKTAVEVGKTLAVGAANLLASAIADRLGFFLQPKKDGQIMRYYMTNLDSTYTNDMPFRNNDELLYFNGRVVNNSPEEVAKSVGDVTAGSNVTMISSRPTGDGKFTYNYVEGVLERPLYPDLEKETSGVQKPQLRLKKLYVHSSTDSIFPTFVRKVYVESYLFQGLHAKYEQSTGNVATVKRLEENDPTYRFWICLFINLDHMMSFGDNPIRVAIRPEGLPLFLSTSSNNAVTWQYKSAGPRGHPLPVAEDLLFKPLSLDGGLQALESNFRPGHFIKMSDRGIELDNQNPKNSLESRFHFRDVIAVRNDP